ncbi:hypothetical protein [Nocardia seriolae]|uniref:DUF8175 domain-containing protein n=1 Tax=Nocardia seriolae TaxID=37332 RepID=A0A0B8N9A3_9NOCA|nr:hypothetical protein [Nocardia seriolae]APA99604.1 hypothetical protein NS506_05558 [Nocardia seriolae]MTJ64180.1 hypothetical protein [Nocardia seriolae]MTJ73149.1 hypothetical protein [Nocardia seriolae]MTJ89174.1 hypothetical protein [Nocardia seriolae]MTK33152.1 hypothetical protein [Nocardia seriolae]
MSEKESSERDGVSFGVIASAALVAVIVIAGLVVYFGHRSKPSAKPEVGTAPVTASDSGATGFASPEVDLFGRRVDIPNNSAGQPLPQDTAKQRKTTDSDWLTAAPQGLTEPHGWQRVYGASVPFSTSDGPARMENGVAVGYSHTPQGAALAAAQITYRLNARPADRDLYVREVRVPAEQLTAYDQALADQRLPKQQPEKVTRYLVASDGFQIENYADDMAIVRLAVRGPVVDNRQWWAAVRLIMVWDAGDWRLKPSTSKTSQTENVDSLAGWTRW